MPDRTQPIDERPQELGLAETLLTQGRSGAAEPGPPPVGEGRYPCISELGRGGMGVVQEALDLQFPRRVAVKGLLRISEATKARFDTEALVNGSLEHPGIAPVYERGLRRDGTPFYVMRKVQGPTLEQALGKAVGLKERLALLPVVVRVAQTLAYAHQRGVVHRDIKPSNIIIGDFGEVVVLDWGIAKVKGVASQEAAPVVLSGAGSTEHGAVLGTPAYMAPEQARGLVERIDERTDVFALGGLLYHILTGRPPYVAASAEQLVALAAEAELTPAAKLAPDAPADLHEICARALERAPERRYPSAKALAEALEGFLSKVVSGVESPWARRVANGILAVSAAMLLATSLFVWVYLPTARTIGAGTYVILAFLGMGLALSFIEWRTRGRYRLSKFCLLLAVLLLLAGAFSTITGVERSIRASLELIDAKRLSGEAASALLRDFALRGVVEALWTIPATLILFAVQLFLWTVLRHLHEAGPQARR